MCLLDLSKWKRVDHRTYKVITKSLSEADRKAIRLR